jgi:hypothetical protein
MAVWDLRGIDFPAAYKGERLLKKTFSFDLDAVGLLDIDRVRIVDAGTVPVCGDVFSSSTSMGIQGLGPGRRAVGTHNYSYWDQVYMVNHGSSICSNMRPIYVELSQIRHLLSLILKNENAIRSQNSNNKHIPFY